MPQYLFVVGAKPFPANHNIEYEGFHCVSMPLFIYINDKLKQNLFLVGFNPTKTWAEGELVSN